MALFTCCTNIFEHYRCHLCNFNTPLKVILHSHTKGIHEDDKCKCNFEDILRCYTCKTCTFRTYSKLIKVRKCCHTTRAKTRIKKRKKCTTKTQQVKRNVASNGFKWFECEHCQAYKSIYQHNLKQHILEKHDFAANNCEVPKSIYKSRKSARGKCAKSPECMDSNGLKWYKCEYCQQYKYNLDLHMRSEHKQRVNSIMEVVVPSKIKPIKDSRRFKCGLCCYKTNRKCLFEHHVATKHSLPKTEKASVV